MASKPNPQLIRLNRYLALSGAGSRRHAEEFIEQGLVKVNGKTVEDLGHKVNPAQDRVTLKGKPITIAQKPVYILFHKPENVLTAMSDPLGRPTVADFFTRLQTRVFPVGRLDWNTEGLLLLTNDGDYAQKVAHPKEGIPKTYLAKVDGSPSDQQLSRLKMGVTIPGGRARATHVERIRKGSDKYDWILLIIDEGRNHQVRNMFQKIGFDVKKLRRVAIGQLRLGNLKKGEFVYLKPFEAEKVFHSRPLRTRKPSMKKNLKNKHSAPR